MLEKLTPEEARQRIEILHDDVADNERKIEQLRDENNETHEYLSTQKTD